MRENSFGYLIQQERKNKKITLEQLAKRTFISERSIQYYEKGERTPNIYTAGAILKALGIEATIGENLDNISLGEHQKISEKENDFFNRVRVVKERYE